jgi:hypothetical protein
MVMIFPVFTMVFPYFFPLGRNSSHVQPPLAPAWLASWWKAAPMECRRPHLSCFGSCQLKKGSTILKFTMFMGDINKYKPSRSAGL